MKKHIQHGLAISLLFAMQFAYAQETSNKPEKIEVLAPITPFVPFVADPKWPTFTLAYQNYFKGEYGRHIFAPNFGAVLPFIRKENKDTGVAQEFGFHAAVFSVMDVGSKPTRMINSDFFVGPYYFFLKGPWGYLFRVSHTSSHLGDEYLLSPQGRNTVRVNLSYEALESVVYYRFDSGLRPYVGVAFLVDTDPESYQTWEFTGGMDYHSKNKYLKGYGKGIFGVHSKISKNYNWTPSLSIKTGLEIEDKIIIGKTMQVLLEYYYGHSTHGQFYKLVESYSAVSLNVNF